MVLVAVVVVHFEESEHQLLKTYLVDEVVELILILVIKSSVNGFVSGRKITILHVIRRKRQWSQQRLFVRYNNKTVDS